MTTDITKQRENKMIRPFIIPLRALMAVLALGGLIVTTSIGCTDKEREYDTFANTRNSSSEDPQPDTPDTTEVVYVYDGVEPRLFDVINIFAPGLEMAHDYYDTGAAGTAMSEILQYYRARTAPVNPNLDLSSRAITASEKNIADQALENRFYTTTFNEGAGTGGMTAYYDMNGTDGTPDWDKIPSGVTDATEFNKQVHRLLFLPYLAKAWHATGEDKYVEKFISLIDDYMGKYAVPSGRNNGIPYTGLQLSAKILDWVDSFPYIISSDKVTAVWLSKVMVWMHDVMQCTRNNWYSPTTSNIYFAQVQAENEFAILFPEYAEAELWLQEGANLVTSQLVTQFNDDGVQNELDLSYHMGVVSNFETIQDFVIANSKQSLYPDDYTSYLKNSCRFVMDMLYPNYSDENFNDTRSDRQTKSVLLRNLRSYSDMFPDDRELLWMATEGAQGDKPSSKIQKYATSGYYMMRSEWGTDGIMLILKNNYDPSDVWHCQSDNGTIALWKGGRRFLPDAGVYTYATGRGSLRSYYASTALHNTMTLGGANIGSGRRLGKYLGEGSAQGYIWLASENASYSNLTHRRAIFLVDGKFFVIVDEGYGTASGSVELHFHLCADNSGSLGIDASVIDDLSSEHVFGAHTVFGDSNNMLFRTFTETSEDYSGQADVTPVSDEIDKTYNRRAYSVSVTKPSGSAARFITVIYPYGAASEADGISVSAQFTDNEAGKEGTFHEDGASVKVTVGGTEYNLQYKI